MGTGLFRSLLRIPSRKKPTSRFAQLMARRRRPVLESLETRTLPSILIRSPIATGIPDLPVGGLAENADPVSGQRDPRADQDAGQIDGPSDGPGGKKITQVIVQADTQVDVQPAQVVVRLIPYGDSQGDPQHGQNDNGQTDSPGGNPSDQEASQSDGPSSQGGDGSSSQGDSSDSSQDVSRCDLPSGQGDKSDRSQANGRSSGQGDGSGGASSTNPVAGTHDGRSDPTKNSRSESHSDNQRAQLDTGQDASTNSGPAVAGTVSGNEVNAANGQANATDRKQHGPGNGYVSGPEQRSQVSATDGKQHSQENTVIAGEDLHSLVSTGSPEPEQFNRYQAVTPGQQQIVPMEDPGQRQIEERVPPAEAVLRVAVEEASYPPAAEVLTSAVSELPECMVQDNIYASVLPQKHGLLTDSLSLDFSLVRSEVHRFFDLIENLGGHATETQIGVLLSSGAVVVAAALACEIARRQARRPSSGSTGALVPKLRFADGADVPSGIGLPNFGQFSVF